MIRLNTSVDRDTRSRTTLYQQNSHLGLLRESFLYRGTKLYNLLPEELKLETKMELFKFKVKNWPK